MTVHHAPLALPRSAITKVTRAVAIAGLSVAIIAHPAAADQTDQIAFDFLLGGIKAAQVVINGKIEGNQYGASGVVETSGLLSALRKLRYEATVAGQKKGDAFTPQRFEETAYRGKDKIDYTTIYRNGTPVSVSRNPPRTPRSTDVDPAKQTGTIDPLTALYAVLRDVDRNEACQLSVFMYDGSKRTQVTLGQRQAKGNQVTCAGEYRRIGGFSKREMSEQPTFHFTLTYSPTPDGKRLRVSDVATDTVLGKGHLKRR